MKPANKRQRVPLIASLHWRYLHQDGKKTWKEIANIKDYNKYSKATICRYMKRKIDDFVIDKRKQNKGRPQKLTKRDKRNIATSRDTTKELRVFYNKTSQSFCWRTDRCFR
jgi:hypothetical protein